MSMVTPLGERSAFFQEDTFFLGGKVTFLEGNIAFLGVVVTRIGEYTAPIKGRETHAGGRTASA